MEPILAALEVQSFGKPVRVEFTKIDGVISHTICLVNGAVRLPVLTTRINAPELPCFTELHQQDDLLFLTGVDGPCHWSMSVQPGEMIIQHGAKIDNETLELFEQRYGLNAPRRAKAEPLGRFLHFDVACRVKEPATDLHNEYMALENFTCGRTIAVISAMNPEDIETGMVCFGNPPGVNSMSPKTHCSMTCISERSIRFAPVEAKVTAFPATLRWSYAVWRMI